MFIKMSWLCVVVDILLYLCSLSLLIVYLSVSLIVTPCLSVYCFLLSKYVCASGLVCVSASAVLILGQLSIQHP